MNTVPQRCLPIGDKEIDKSNLHKTAKELGGGRPVTFTIMRKRENSGDNIINILDLVLMIQDLLGVNAQQAVAYLQQVLTTDEFEDITEEFHYVGTPFLLAWPNPSNEYMFIAGNGIATIYDMMGRVVKEINIDGTYRWDTRGLPTGLYHIANLNTRIRVTLLK